MLRLCAWLCLCVSLACAADQKPKIEIPPEVLPIVELARSAAPEVFADAIVRLIEAGRIPQREAQIELLTQAFAIASTATEPIRLTALPAVPADTRAIYRGRGRDPDLDALSLQSRVLRELLTVDPAKARQLFSAIARPVLDPRPCSDPFVADASPYFEIAAGVAQSAFSPQEKEKAAHIQFLSAVLAGIRSPGELAPFAQALESVALTPAEWALVGAGFSEKLGAIGLDYRAFAVSFGALQAEMPLLEQMSQVEGLHDAFRRYAVTQLTAPRCKPDLVIDTSALALTDDETKPSTRDDGFDTGEKYFSSADGQAIGEKLMRLQSLRGSAELNAAFDDFFRDFRAWQPSGDDAGVLHQRATVLRALLPLVPSGENRDRVLNLCASALASSPAQRSAPAEWVWEMRQMLDNASADTPKLIARFRSSGDAALDVYGYLFSIAGREW